MTTLRRAALVSGLKGPLRSLRRVSRSVRQVVAPRGRHREVRAAISALRHRDYDEFAARTRRCVLGLRSHPQMQQLLQAAADHARGARSHSEASERIRTVTEGLATEDFAPEALMAAETFVRAAGLFAASLGLRPLIHAGLERRSVRKSDDRDLRRAAVSAIHEGDLEQAQAVHGRIGHAARASDPHSVTVGRYLDIWAGTTSSADVMGLQHVRAGHREADRRFADTVHGGAVLVYGPGPTTTLPELSTSPMKVIRILMPEVYAWDSPQDLVAGQADIAYMNHEAQLWLGGLSEEERRDVADRFSILVAKKSAELVAGVRHAGLRAAWSAAPLYLTGSENTVPAILFDLLAFAEVPVGVVGTTFFASAASYRPDNRRLQFYEGVKVDSQGRTGHRLERCTMLASHNALENRRLVSNLVRAGRVTGDPDFIDAVSLTDERYLEILDRLYGVELL